MYHLARSFEQRLLEELSLSNFQESLLKNLTISKLLRNLNKEPYKGILPNRTRNLESLVITKIIHKDDPPN